MCSKISEKVLGIHQDSYHFNLYIYIHTHTHTYIHIYIYIYTHTFMSKVANAQRTLA